MEELEEAKIKSSEARRLISAKMEILRLTGYGGADQAPVEMGVTITDPLSGEMIFQFSFTSEDLAKILMGTREATRVLLVMPRSVENIGRVREQETIEVKYPAAITGYMAINKEPQQEYERAVMAVMETDGWKCEKTTSCYSDFTLKRHRFVDPRGPKESKTSKEESNAAESAAVAPA